MFTQRQPSFNKELRLLRQRGHVTKEFLHKYIHKLWEKPSSRRIDLRRAHQTCFEHAVHLRRDEDCHKGMLNYSTIYKQFEGRKSDVSKS